MTKESVEYNGKKGVWRTVSGRHIFIAEGEDLRTAMKNSGKFSGEGQRKYNSKWNTKDELKDRANAKRMGKTIPGMKETADKIVKDIDIKAIARKQRDKLEKLKDKNKEYLTKTGKEIDDLFKDKTPAQQASAVKILAEAHEESGNITKNQRVYIARKANDMARDNQNVKYQDLVNSALVMENPLTQHKIAKDTAKAFGSKVKDDRWVQMQKNIREKVANKNANKEYFGEHFTEKQYNNYLKEKDYKQEEKATDNWVPIEQRMREAGIEFASGEATASLQSKANKVINNMVKQKLAKQQTKKLTPAQLRKQHEEALKNLPEGSSNRKPISDYIQDHILSYYDKPEDFVDQMDAMSYLPTNWHRGQELAKGGSYLIYNGDVQDFMKKLHINPKGKEYDDYDAFQMYTSLIGRESEKLYNKLKNKK